MAFTLTHAQITHIYISLHTGKDYFSLFLTSSHQNRERSAPTFPKVNTFKMALPLDPTRFHVQRGSQVQLGCEQQR